MSFAYLYCITQKCEKKKRKKFLLKKEESMKSRAMPLQWKIILLRHITTVSIRWEVVSRWAIICSTLKTILTIAVVITIPFIYPTFEGTSTTSSIICNRGGSRARFIAGGHFIWYIHSNNASPLMLYFLLHCYPF